MKKQNERGVSAVEFALILPVLLLILFGIIEFGLIIYDKAVITNASREVARAAIAQGANITNVKTDIVNKYSNNLITFSAVKLTVSDIVVTPSNGCANFSPSFGNPIQVTVNYNYKCLVIAPIMGLFGGNWNGNISLNAMTTMRCE